MRERIEVDRRVFVHSIMRPTRELAFADTQYGGEIVECRTEYPAARCACGHYDVAWYRDRAEVKAAAPKETPHG